MKILLYIDENRLAWGWQLIQLIEALERKGVHSHVVCKSGGDFAARLAREGMAHDLFDAPIAWLARSARGLERIIDSIKPDIIHTRLSSAARLGGYWAKVKNIPVVQSVDKFPKAHYHKNADFLLPCSHAIKEHMLALGFSEQKMQVVFNALDVERYQPLRHLRESKRNELGLDGGQLLIMGAGRFVRWKGFDNLLRAYGELLSRHPGAKRQTRLLLAGDGEEKSKLVRLIGSLNIEKNVIMPGFVKDVRPYMQASDIFVLPSKTPEPFGVVLLEAMASGLACIATRGGGALDMIIEHENGWFVDQDSVPSLSAALRRAAEDKDARVRIAAQAQKSASRFDVNQVATQIISIYESLAR